MESKYVCPCGLICTDCLFFKKDIYESAVKLRDAIKHSQLDTFLGSIAKSKSYNFIADHLNAERNEFEKSFEPFNKFPAFLEVLDSLIQLQCKTTCRETCGCSMTGTTHKCEALKCVNEKGLEGCWACAENEKCEKLNFVKKVYGETINENFECVKRDGITGVKSKENEYYAWQRTMNK